MQYSPNCPYCGTMNTQSTPLSGPASDFYCPTCDRAF